MDKKTRKSGKAGQLIGILIYVLIGAASGFLLMDSMDRLLDSGISKAGMLLACAALFIAVYVVMTLQIIIHEAGHLLFGLFTGYRFSSFRIFSWMWVKEEGRIRFRHLSIAGTGGQCLMAPPELVNGKIPVILYNLGGSIMNLISAAVFFGLSFLFAGGSLPQAVLRISALIGTAFAIMNGVPLHMGPVDNDGCNTLSLLRSPEAVRAFWIQMKTNDELSRGRRLRDMPEEWFAVPDDSAMRNGIEAFLGPLACSRLMDEHRFQEADALMEHLLSLDSGISGLHRALMTCDRMYVELVSDNRAEKLEEMMTRDQQRIMQSMKKYPSVLRTSYAMALLKDRDVEKASVCRKNFDRYAATYPYPAELEGEREMMAIAEQKAEET